MCAPRHEHGRALIGFALLLLTLAGVMARPRGIKEWVVAAVGGLAMVSVGALSPREAVAAVTAQWNVLLFFLGLMATSAAAEQSGALAWLTRGALTLSRGRRDVLLVLVSALCVGVTATLSNDATILLLTPLVLRVTQAAGVPPLPYALACALLANAASTLLPIANPTNIVILQAHPLVLSDYLRHLIGPSLAAVIAMVITLLVAHRHTLAGPIARDAAIATTPGAPLFAAALVAVLAVYLAALELRLPIGPVSVLGAGFLVILLQVRGCLQLRAFERAIEWGIFPFFAGLVVVVAGAARAGLVDLTAAALQELAAVGVQGAVLVGGAAALLANGMNNLPAAVLLSAALDRAAGSLADEHTVTAALLVGVDIGPAFTSFGSIATLLWLMLLRRRGLQIGSLTYVRHALAPAAAALGAALLALALLR